MDLVSYPDRAEGLGKYDKAGYVIKKWNQYNIYCQIDCFVVSQLFSVAKYAGRFKVGSKPA